jgi:nucleotide-binding universal stress UspA family protein
MRLPVKKILAPTDFSEPSEEAAKTALDLAAVLETELLVVHVVSPVPPFPGNIAPNAPGFNIHMYQEDLATQSGRELEAFAKRLGGRKTEIHSVLREGDPGEQIVDLAEKEGVDLIVIATKGRTGLKRFVFGSVAEKVVRYSPCPVLVIPEASQAPSEHGGGES